MWPFKKSVASLCDSGMFNGFTDWHSHILHGVDDGIKTLDESLEALENYQKLGFRKVWLTPHIMEDYPNTPEELKNIFASLKDAWKGDVEIGLAAENMLDNLFEERLDSGELLPIGDNGTHLLVETSYFTPPMDLDGLFDRIMSKGYYPLFAHPERYRYMSEKDYERLKDRGILFQCNFMSLVGAYGENARKKCEWLLDHDMIDVVGSDIHRWNMVREMILRSPSKRKYLDDMCEVAKKSL